ncbi:MAG: hypothetical protein RLZ33_2716 [Bacteroidota bacterium]|jgi:hypothetical protein
MKSELLKNNRTEVNSSIVTKLRFAFWLFFVLFSLNTLGNLFAETLTETLIFTPLTILLAVLSLRLARN